MARMTDKQLRALIDDDTETGGTGWTDIMHELWRARESEARLADALKALTECSHPEGSNCNHYRQAHAALKAMEEGT